MGCSEGDVIDANHNYCGITNTSTNQLTDEDLALEEGLRRMSLAVASGRPWWVSIGVHRPHTVYRVPPGFYGPEVYPTSGDAVLPPQYPRPPVNAPFMSGNWEGGDINDAAHGCPDCIVPANRSVEYRRWYYAAVTWADHSLGRALQHLQDMGPAVVANTIVVFHSDHGYQLGELNEVGGGMCCSPPFPFLASSYAQPAYKLHARLSTCQLFHSLHVHQFDSSSRRKRKCKRDTLLAIVLAVFCWSSTLLSTHSPVSSSSNCVTLSWPGLIRFAIYISVSWGQVPAPGLATVGRKN